MAEGPGVALGKQSKAAKKRKAAGDSETGLPSMQAINRISKDLMSFHASPPPGIHISHDEDKLNEVLALIIGNEDTPYEGGFFLFKLTMPNDYPINSPKAILMTTDSGNVRFNPNFYRNGRVCLSILGTWDGPCWSPAQNILSVLISIQSLFSEKPYHNEPGFETAERTPGDIERYNQIIAHETLRVAVYGMMKNTRGLPLALSFRKIMRKEFLKYFPKYLEVIEKYKRLDGSEMADPFNESCYFDRKFNFEKIKKNLTDLHAIVSKEEVDEQKLKEMLAVDDEDDFLRLEHHSSDSDSMDYDSVFLQYSQGG